MCEGEKGSAGGLEFVLDGGEDQGGYDGPEVVGGPAETDNDEELGVVRECYSYEFCTVQWDTILRPKFKQALPMQPDQNHPPFADTVYSHAFGGEML